MSDETGAAVAPDSRVDRVSVVLPTFNRLPALIRNLPSLLALRGVDEIVVVDDGSTDGTADWLRSLGCDRITIIEQPQRGSPAARNRGIDEVRGGWVLMTEDDCHLPPEFAVVLLEVARERSADVVSAPWLVLTSLEQADAAMAAGRRAAIARIGLATHPGVFPLADLETPFLNGIILARREVFDKVRYDERLRGNAWREETSLFLTAVDAGFRCVLTPRTASFQLDQWEGGQRRGRIAYETWAIRNNWRFLWRHRRILRRLGAIRDPISAQAGFIARRTRATVAGTLGARLRGLGAARWDRVQRR